VGSKIPGSYFTNYFDTSGGLALLMLLPPEWLAFMILLIVSTELLN